MLLALLVLLASVLAASPDLCSPNLAPNDGSQFFLYNSKGACSDACNGYAYAIVQAGNCWCSNVKPADTTDTSDCSSGCPGYPDDTCGNEDEGLYGYYQLGQPSSTEQASTSSSSTSSAPPSTSSTSSTSTSSSSSPSSSSTPESSSTTPSSSSESSSSTPTSTSTSSSRTTSSSSSSTTTSSSSTSTSTTSSSTETTSSSVSSQETTTSSPAISFITVTGSGQVRTITQTQMPTPTDDIPSTAAADASATPTAEHKSFWDKKGAVAGTFTAVGVVVVILLLLLLLLICRRRRADNESIISDPKAAIVDKSPHSRSHRESFAVLDDDPTLVPIFDQRVDPTQMYMRWDNATSQQSLQDNQDYSRRVLRVANPDGD